MEKISKAIVGMFLLSLNSGCSKRISEDDAIRIAGDFLESRVYPDKSELHVAMRWEGGAWQGEITPRMDSAAAESEISWPAYIEVSRSGEVTGYMGFLTSTDSEPAGGINSGSLRSSP